MASKGSVVDPGFVTVADLLAHGIDEVSATCPSCRSSWLVPVSFLPPATSLRKVGELLICPRCGSQKVRIEMVASALRLT